MSAGLGFSEAATMALGGRVVVGGRVREVLNIHEEGAAWPYFLIERVAGEIGYTAGELTWVSWQTCGRAATVSV